MLEIEIKAKVADAAALREALRAQGFKRQYTLLETDTYYSGVDRSFAATDEALRLRSTENLDTGGTQCALTYKGPKLDSRSATRQEYEVPVQNGADMQRILECLGHAPVLQVQKQREYHEQGGITACVDDVRNLGSYMELETLAPEGQAYDDAVDGLLTLLEQLGIPRENCTRTSYLEMLLRQGN